METDPYQVPESRLESPENFNRSLGWKVYFFVITGLSAIMIIVALADPAAGLPEYGLTAVTIAGTVGLFGFVFVKPIFHPAIWMVTLIGYVLFGVSYYFIANIDLRGDMSDIEYILNIVIGWVISIPALYGLFLYSKRDDPAWENWDRTVR